MNRLKSNLSALFVQVCAHRHPVCKTRTGASYVLSSVFRHRSRRHPVCESRFLTLFVNTFHTGNLTAELCLHCTFHLATAANGVFSLRALRPAASSLCAQIANRRIARRKVFSNNALVVTLCKSARTTHSHTQAHSTSQKRAISRYTPFVARELLDMSLARLPQTE